MGQNHNGGEHPRRYVRLISKEDVFLTGGKVQLIEDCAERSVTRELTLHDMVREEKIGDYIYRWYAAGGMTVTESEGAM